MDPHKAILMIAQSLKIAQSVAFEFGIFNELLATQNVNLARFARNVKCDFLGDFQTLWII